MHNIFTLFFKDQNIHSTWLFSIIFGYFDDLKILNWCWIVSKNIFNINKINNFSRIVGSTSGWKLILWFKIWFMSINSYMFQKLCHYKVHVFVFIALKCYTYKYKTYRHIYIMTMCYNITWSIQSFHEFLH